MLIVLSKNHKELSSFNIFLCWGCHSISKCFQTQNFIFGLVHNNCKRVHETIHMNLSKTCSKDFWANRYYEPSKYWLANDWILLIFILCLCRNFFTFSCAASPLGCCAWFFSFWVGGIAPLTHQIMVYPYVRHTCIPAASGSRLSCNSTEFPGRSGPRLWT